MQRQRFDVRGGLWKANKTQACQCGCGQMIIEGKSWCRHVVAGCDPDLTVDGEGNVLNECIIRDGVKEVFFATPH